MISLSIDVTKIKKEKLYKGAKGTYLNCVLIETPNSKYADYMVVESISKEERDAGNKGTILGDGKIIGTLRGEAPQDTSVAPPSNPDYKGDDNGDDDLPF